MESGFQLVRGRNRGRSKFRDKPLISTTSERSAKYTSRWKQERKQLRKYRPKQWMLMSSQQRLLFRAWSNAADQWQAKFQIVSDDRKTITQKQLPRNTFKHLIEFEGWCDLSPSFNSHVYRASKFFDSARVLEEGNFVKVFHYTMNFVRPSLTHNFKQLHEMSSEERKDAWLEDDLLGLKRLAADGWWRTTEEVFLDNKGEQVNLFPKYLNDMVYTKNHLITKNEREDKDVRPFEKAFFRVCERDYESARFFYGKNKGGYNRNPYVLVKEAAGGLRALKIDRRMFFLLCNVIGCTDREQAMSTIIEYLWRWLTVEYLCNGCWFGIPSKAFRRSFWDKRRTDTYYRIKDEFGFDYLGGIEGVYPRFNEPGANSYHCPNDLSVYSTVQTLHMFEELLHNFALGAKHLDYVETRLNEEGEPEEFYIQRTAQEKFNEIKTIILGFFSMACNQFVVNKMTRTMRPRFLQRRQFRSLFKTEWNNGDPIGGFEKDGKFLTVRELYKVMGTERFVRNPKLHGLCPHLASKRCLVLAVSGSGKTFYSDRHPEWVDGDTIMSEQDLWPHTERWWEDDAVCKKTNDCWAQLINSDTRQLIMGAVWPTSVLKYVKTRHIIVVKTPERQLRSNLKRRDENGNIYQPKESDFEDLKIQQDIYLSYAEKHGWTVLEGLDSIEPCNCKQSFNVMRDFCLDCDCKQLYCGDTGRCEDCDHHYSRHSMAKPRWNRVFPGGVLSYDGLVYSWDAETYQSFHGCGIMYATTFEDKKQRLQEAKDKAKKKR